MTDGEIAAGGEIDALRQRAYGRNADIHSDPAALQRLRELEGMDAPGDDTPTVLSDSGSGVPPAVDSAPASDVEEAEQRPRFTLRRPVVIAVAALAVVVAVVVSASLEVQGAQRDPFRVGASQLARLSVDAGYRVPQVFAGTVDANAVVTSGSDSVTQAYQEFHGLRAIVSGTKNPCLTVYAAAAVKDPAFDSFTGAAFYGCAAGKFPAAVQFRLDTDGLPAGLKSALRGKTALQFVYDQPHQEIVVFATE